MNRLEVLRGLARTLDKVQNMIPEGELYAELYQRRCDLQSVIEDVEEEEMGVLEAKLIRIANKVARDNSAMGQTDWDPDNPLTTIQEAIALLMFYGFDNEEGIESHVLYDFINTIIKSK